MTLDLSILLALGGILVTGGAAWGGARAALQGLRKQFDEHVELDAMIQRENVATQREILDRLISIETRLSMME